MAAAFFPHTNAALEMSPHNIYTNGLKQQYEASATNLNNLIAALNGVNPNQIGQGKLLEAQLAMTVFSIVVLMISNILSNLGSTYKGLVNNFK